jgi:TPR repeat protein
MGLMKWESTHGVKQDRASALHLLKLAAAQGHIEAKRLCEDFQPKLNAKGKHCVIRVEFEVGGPVRGSVVSGVRM